MHAMPSQQMEQLQAATVHKVRAELRAHALLLKCVNVCPGACACVPSEKNTFCQFSHGLMMSHVYAGGWCCCCRCCCCRCCFALLQPNEKLLGASFNLSVSLTWDARHSAMGQYHVQGSNQLHSLISEVTLL